ncbi:TPA: hypothetical protein ENS27_12495, partial [bacterium]|nr:hypothetical protein [bacterium]
NVDTVVDKINNSIKTLGIDAECVKGGSIAKNTFLKHDHDVDLFVKFSPEYPDMQLSEILYNILRKTFPRQSIQRVHGSRDYFQFRLGGLDYEIIPVINIHISNLHESRNITDFSPLHVEWTGKKIKERPELADEIRVAKQFCKANNVYGAESYINGFSGHIMDILVIHYGSFLSLVEKFATITDVSAKNPIIIDTEKLLDNPLNQLNKSKITPLIIIDPIQPNRNAAAALSREKLLIFVDACKKFIDSPSEDFFRIKKFNIREKILEMKKSLKNAKIIILKVSTIDGSKDIVGTKVYKVYEYMMRQLELNEFKILDSAWNFDYLKKRAVILYAFERQKLSDFVEKKGPPLNAKIDVKKFLEKHENTKINGNRIYATVKRKYAVPEQLLKDLLIEKYISDKVKKIYVDKII